MTQVIVITVEVKPVMGDIPEAGLELLKEAMLETLAEHYGPAIFEIT